MPDGVRRARATDAPGISRVLVEAFTQANVAYYRRRGWEVVGTYAVAGGIPVHHLVREARR